MVVINFLTELIFISKWLILSCTRVDTVLKCFHPSYCYCAGGLGGGAGGMYGPTHVGMAPGMRQPMHPGSVHLSLVSYHCSSLGCSLSACSVCGLLVPSVLQRDVFFCFYLQEAVVMEGMECLPLNTLME